MSLLRDDPEPDDVLGLLVWEEMPSAYRFTPRTVAAIDIAGLAVAFPVGVGLALVLGVITTYWSTKVGNAQMLALGVAADGTREILGLWIEQTEGAKFWLKVFNDLKTRGVADVLIAVTDGLKGIGEALEQKITELVETGKLKYYEELKASIPPGLVEMLRNRARSLHGAHVHPVGALTVGLAGETLTEMGELAEAGCVAFSHARPRGG